MIEPYISGTKDYTEKPDLNLFKKHTHSHYEIYCFLSGDAKYFVEGSIYDLKPNDILIIKKAESHALMINHCVPYSRYVINFNAAALSEVHGDELISVIDEKPLGKSNRIPSNEIEKNMWLYYMDQIVNAQSMDIKRLYLTVLLRELCQNIRKTEEKSPASTTGENLIKYINRNLMTISSLDEVCSEFYISKTHLNRKFKAMTGSTVWDYITVKRLIAAKDLLMNGWQPKDVAEKCGYPEYSSFYRAYKSHFGISPKEDYHR